MEWARMGGRGAPLVRAGEPWFVSLWLLVMSLARQVQQGTMRIYTVTNRAEYKPKCNYRIAYESVPGSEGRWGSEFLVSGAVRLGTSTWRLHAQTHN